MYTAVLMLAMVSSSETADFGGRRGGGCCGSSYGCSGYYGGCSGYGGGCSGYYGGSGRGGYSYAPGMNPSGYAMPYGSSAPMAMAQDPNNPARQSNYFDPAQSNTGATVRVLVPSAKAEIWIDEKATQQNGTERTYYSPPLQKGGKYTVKARWTDDGRTVNRQRTVDVQPGQSVTVDFRQESGEKLTNPKSEKNIKKVEPKEEK